jgi:hypothetical protein
MKLATAIFQIVAWFAVRGIDKIIAKWVAYFFIAWQANATKEAQAAFNEGINEVKLNMPDKAKAWEDWRASHQSQTQKLP